MDQGLDVNGANGAKVAKKGLDHDDTNLKAICSRVSPNSTRPPIKLHRGPVHNAQELVE